MDAAALLAPLAAEPERAALVLDVDGTLAPIAPRPELAVVPRATQERLAALAGRYLLIACVSGRAGDEAAALVGVEGISYVGNHGLELDPRRDEFVSAVAGFRRAVEHRWPVEDKVLSLSFHYRQAADEAAAVAVLETVADAAAAAGLEARWGRKVLEVRPAAAADKGAAVRALLAGSGAARGLYAGDDTTDLDAFRGLGESELEYALRIAVGSPEAPPALIAAADLVVDGTAGLLEALGAL